MAVNRFKLPRSVKVVLMVALLCYLSIVLVGMAARMQKPAYPWTVNDGYFPAALVGLKHTDSRLTSSGNQTAEQKTAKPKTAPCPKTIASLTKYSKWFRERYQPGIKLFLDRDDTKHYDNLSASGPPFGFKRQNLTVLSQILQHKDFANPPVHGLAGRQSCIRCAVVGCGGILNGSGAGKEIDGHDYVFRLNRALSSGRFANDVGKRTTFYTFFPESQHLNDVEDENVLVFYAIFKAYDADYALNMMNGEKPPKYISRGKTYGVRTPVVSPTRVKFVHPNFFTYVFKTFLDSKAYRPTTGALVVFLALHICDEVTIYGFGYDPRFTMHYYDTKFVVHTRASTGTHDVDNERKLWHKLHEEGAIRLFKRDL
ncbi:alpha-N-acetylgalactosaminide alpha-2,6-sialyltransferase 1-like [Acanthaster planci]|uniref:alpha-N-acetylgalactosaminide alpha-2,6-sialyltransferase n=1 Tax=Acanthaster planci TaxID=133434 RepID=A0A8B7XG50_ACAPL|nr:alpha-N-acetylgalactosaminide alpha-2,6-sialyltransferase 1-like [Acanthaster planci]XP_022079758.1 alpha-N-acetylgalactosaminide alpha-2,6-sialyltransferase 1-like [Acanthaster planci]XP_022079759.1 alpha-N-acetylgalactosaminide alpha-2,6-sialyltransferase 1-like [Acanthaster planci]XP_022079760.1 alpha-N-acetylgalactosaminide alpha-2,6-sialyltransferase 1-like [Acanthaster planci]XP_022079761.1 alpha-N-acetylgalactosaminide alpha-2,6-sialyltransferase 1-like [Acanthaster planci]XP_0220797